MGNANRSGCDGVLTVLVPWWPHQHSPGTALAALDYARPGAPHILLWLAYYAGGQDVYSRTFKVELNAATWLTRLTCVVDIDGQVEVCRWVFDSVAESGSL